MGSGLAGRMFRSRSPRPIDLSSQDAQKVFVGFDSASVIMIPVEALFR